MKAIQMIIKDLTFEIELYDNPSSEALYESLPQKLSMSRWGGEYYGTLSVKIPSQGAKRDIFEEGEVALWPTGNAFCIFFGPTPASVDNRPKMASPGIPFGKIVSGDLSDLDSMGSSISVELVK
jgi:hypothetical protein